MPIRRVVITSDVIEATRSTLVIGTTQPRHHKPRTPPHDSKSYRSGTGSHMGVDPPQESLRRRQAPRCLTALNRPRQLLGLPASISSIERCTRYQNARFGYAARCRFIPGDHFDHDDHSQ